MKTKLLALACAATLTAAAQAAEYTRDVLVVIEPDVATTWGYEQLDTWLADGIAIYEEALSETDTDFTNVIQDVYTETTIVGETSTDDPYDVQDAMCEYREDDEDFPYNGYDLIVYLVDDIDNGGSAVGVSAEWCDSVAVEVNTTTFEAGVVHYVIPHEIGHIDDLEHYRANDYYDETGEKRLMYEHALTEDPASGLWLTDDDIEDLNAYYEQALAGYGTTFNYSEWFGYSLTEYSDTAYLTVDDATIIEGESITGTIDLLAAINEDVSVEVYTVSQTTTAGDDYDDKASTVYRVTIPAGELSAEFTLPTIDDEEVEDSETFTMGIRYGRGVNASDLYNEAAVFTITDNDVAEVEEEVTETSSDSDSSDSTDEDEEEASSGGGGSAGGLMIGGLAAMGLIRRRKLALAK